MRLSSSLATLIPSCRIGLLIDLENLAYTKDGDLISHDELGARLDEVLAMAGPVQYRLVAAQRHMLIRYGAELAVRNLRWHECPSGPDEADWALTQVGLDLLLHGFKRLMIASGDHFFASLGELCELQVAVPRGVKVSAQLAAAGRVLLPPPDIHRPVIRVAEAGSARLCSTVPTAA